MVRECFGCCGANMRAHYVCCKALEWKRSAQCVTCPAQWPKRLILWTAHTVVWVMYEVWAPQIMGAWALFIFSFCCWVLLCFCASQQLFCLCLSDMHCFFRTKVTQEIWVIQQRYWNQLCVGRACTSLLIPIWAHKCSEIISTLKFTSNFGEQLQCRVH